MSGNSVSIQFHVSGFKEKEWSNPSNTSHRLYIHKMDGEHKIECGYLDTIKKTYRGPDKRRKHADHNVRILTEDGEGGDGSHLATVSIEDETIELYYTGKLESSKPTSSQPKKVVGQTIPAPVVDEVLVVPVGENVLEHLASITQSDTKITISYGNTVEVKSRSRGFIQSQYPKFSLSVEMEGGNVLSKIEEAADAVVDLVEQRLTDIVNQMTNEK